MLLVVEDDPAVQHVLRLMLEAEGYDVALASDGRHGLDYLSTGSPALIVLDLGLPDMSGEEFAAEVSRRGHRPGIPLLVLTASYSDPEDTQDIATRVGAEACVTKPFEAEQFLAEISRLLEPATGRATRN
jgi:DNA-binding response OmpR family regulator